MRLTARPSRRGSDAGEVVSVVLALTPIPDRVRPSRPVRGRMGAADTRNAQHRALHEDDRPTRAVKHRNVCLGKVPCHTPSCRKPGRLDAIASVPTSDRDRRPNRHAKHPKIVTVRARIGRRQSTEAPSPQSGGQLLGGSCPRPCRRHHRRWRATQLKKLVCADARAHRDRTSGQYHMCTAAA